MDIDLHACLSGDPEAWDGFVTQASPVMYAAIARIVRSHDVAADVLQDAFLRLLKNDRRLLRSYDPDRARLTTWLTIVARSTAIDHVRRKRAETVPLMPGDAPHEQPQSVEDEVPVQVLSDRQRQVVELLFERQLSVEQVATVLGVNPQTVRSMKHKALSRLRQEMEENRDPSVSAGEIVDDPAV